MGSMEEMPPLLPHLLTCHTDGCINQDVPILVDMPLGSQTICGPCALPITDVSDPLA